MIDVSKTIPQLLKENQQKLSISVEIVPPQRGASIEQLFQIIEDIQRVNPLWVDVTSHSANVEWSPYQNDSKTLYKKLRHRKNPGTIAICGAIQYKFNIPTVAHLLCRGFTKQETEDALIDLNYLGVKNILAIRGDGNSNDGQINEQNGYAVDLLEQILAMNKGAYLNSTAHETEFTVGVACYPEKHLESPNLASCIDRLKRKQEKGAKFSVSQMFFENQSFFNFMEETKESIHLPIIPGLKILTNQRHLTSIPRNFFVNLPSELVKQINAARTPEALTAVGVDWAFQQCTQLIENGHNHLHFYIMRNTKPFMSLMERLRVL